MNHYIYAHLEDGLPVYVGVGQGGRAWDAAGRTPLHQTWMMEKLPEMLSVQWVCTGVTKQEAHALERQIIYEIKPRYNKQVPNKKCRHLLTEREKRPNNKYRQKNSATPC